MKILILHPTFPGQFGRQASWLAGQGHHVMFICMHRRIDSLAGVTTLMVKAAAEASGALNQGAAKAMLATASAYHEVMLKLSDQGYQPDAVISHTGWGCGLYTHRIWPLARRVAYSEWFFAFPDPLLEFNQRCRWPLRAYAGKSSRNKLGKSPDRNALMLYELEHAHQVVAPTHWQRLQLPTPLRERCAVIYEGVVDSAQRQAGRCDLHHQGKRLRLTYGTRGMEPMRGFPEMVHELRQCLDHFPELEVEIAGEDQIFYDASKPKGFRRWGQWAQVKLGRWIAEGRVRFLGRLPATDYQLWLSNSDVHLYLTQPFVGSWSLLDAMAAGCCLVASNVAPVREFLDQQTATLVDHRRAGWLAPALRPLFGSIELRQLRSTAVQRLAAQFTVADSLRLWQAAICHNCQY